MNRKYIYPILVVLVAVGFFLFEEYTDNKEAKIEHAKGEDLKETTNDFYLPSSTTEQIVHHNYYSLSYNEKYEQAEWVAYELKNDHLSQNNFKRPYFEIDKSIKTKAAHWRNYKKSGFDRGHLCPAGDRRFSKEAYNETFLTSNISPQRHSFNSGVWNRLEQKVRYWARRYDGVFVVTGGILNNKLQTIGEEKVAVPDYFYKILLDNSDGKTKMIAFLFPHKETKRPLSDFVVSVDEVEALTGIDFFPKIEDAKENRLEAKSDYRDWSFK